MTEEEAASPANETPSEGTSGEGVTAAAKTNTDKKKKAKKSYRKFYIGGGILLVIGLIYVGMMPITGTIKFGICRVFIEQRAVYPLYIDISSVLEREWDVRIEYTVINEFGRTMFNTVTCFFRPDPQNTYALNDVVLNRRKIDPAILERFNPTIPAIIANPPDLTVPFAPKDDLRTLWKPPRYE